MDRDAVARFVSQHDVIYETPPRFWEDGFPIGNGHFGGMVWQPDGIEIGLTKLDVWDRRVENPPHVPFDRLKHLFATDPDQANRELTEEAQRNDDFPYPKPLGRLRIDIEHIFVPLYQTISTQTQRLRLHEACVECRYETNYKATRFDCFVHPDRNLLVVEAHDEWVHPWVGGAPMRQRISLFREFDEVLGLPETGADDGVLWIRYPFPDGFEYVLALGLAGVEHTEPVIFPNEVSFEALLSYPEPELNQWTVVAGAATSMDSADPMSAALGMVREAVAEQPGPRRETHRKWWHDFWSRSGVELQDRFVESLWHVSLYQLASTSRGKTAPGLCGLWNMMKNAPWHGDYHGDINMVMTYWGIFGANHLELGEPYFETFSKLLPIARQQTADLYGIDGLKYPIATLDTGAELCANYYRIMQCTTGFYGLVFWWRWLYERDEAVLREQIFPILEEGSKFYLGIADEMDGVLHFGPSWAPEQGPFPCTNATNDIALIKPLWQAYVDACQVLGAGGEVLEGVKQGLEKFPPYPVKDGRFLDSYTAGDHIRLNHPGLLAMVVPGHEVDADHPLRRVALRTADAMFDLTVRKGFEGRRAFCCDLTWPWLVACAVKLGDGDLAQRYLYDIGISEHLKPNGMFSLNCCGIFESEEEKRAAFDFTDPGRHGAIMWCPTTREGRERYFQFIQAPGGVLYAVTEMLLQSHGGLIRVFPAVPEEMVDCAFRDLLAEGGFRVSARMASGEVEYVVLTNPHGGACTMRMPRERTWWISRPGAEAHAVTGRDLAFQTQPGEAVVVAAGPRADAPDTSLSPGVKPGVKGVVDVYGKEITLGKRRGL